MAEKYFWAGLLARIFYGCSVLCGLAFVVISGANVKPLWEFLIACISFAISGLFWDILSDIGARLSRIEREQTFMLKWIQKADK